MKLKSYYHMKVLNTILLILFLNVFGLAQGVSVKDGRLAFNSIEDYENFLDSSNSESFSVSVETLFKNKKKSADTLIEDDFLASILNETNIIEIAEKVYKIDFEKQLIFVLADINNENLKLLQNKNTSNGKIKVYPTSVDILNLDEDSSDFREKKISPVKGKGPNAGQDWDMLDPFEIKGCKDGSAHRKKSTNRISNGKWPVLKDQAYPDEKTCCSKLKPEAKHVYEQAGIYFSLLGKFQYKVKNVSFITWGDAVTKIKYTYTYTYKPRCREEKNNGTDVSKQVSCDWELVKRFYQGTRRLAKYKVHSEFTCNIHGCYSTNLDQYEAILSDIVSGY
jgi:hypothetical protein